jgi:hypothetical protein
VISNYVALVADPSEVPTNELTVVAAALQTQATRDLGPTWGLSAGVSAFTDVKSVPIGQWPIIVQATISDPNALGYHTDDNNQPYSIVLYQPGWELTASHECLEMLVDPFGNRLVPGPSIDPAKSNDRVQYLLEVCDPCEDPAYAYSINGILVSDFITPDYHQPDGTTGARYDFAGKISAPRQLLPNGYISYADPLTGHVWQGVADAGGTVSIKDLGAGTLGKSMHEFTHTSAKAKGINTWDYGRLYNPGLKNVQRFGAMRDKARLASAALAAHFTQ